MSSKKTLTYQKLIRDFTEYSTNKESPFLNWNWKKVRDIVTSCEFKTFEQNKLESRKRQVLWLNKINRQLCEDVVSLFDSVKILYPRKKKNTMSNLDQFYTKPTVAKECFNDFINIAKINLKDYIFLEPSAGDGSFFKLISPSKIIGLDLEPKCDGIIQENFFNYKYSGNNRIIVIGNPPFGKNSSLAVKFFNYASSIKNVDYIAFILPRTFNKVSIQNKLNMEFHLIKSIQLADDSFLLNGISHNVPCCFQIWKRQKNPRNAIILSLDNDLFVFVKKTNSPDLAVRRVGGTVGKCTQDIASCKDHSYYFLKVNNSKNILKIMNYINKLRDDKKFLTVASQSAGVRSMSRGEFIEVLNKNPFNK